jgi:RimJ/RimL family protein N-acetyltransferase
MQLETERLYLRTPQLDDAPAVQKLVRDERIARTTLNIPHPYPEGAAVEWIKRIHASDDDIHPHLMFLKESDTLVGSVGMSVSRRHNQAEVGYWVGVPYWGNGYATEGLQSLVDFGFSQLNLHRIFGEYYTTNPASRRVMEKVGMIYEATLRDHVHHQGEYKDVGFCGILKHEWEAAQST